MKNQIDRISWSTDGGALQNRCLIIYQLKASFKAELWNSGFMHWMSKPCQPIETFRAKSYEEVLEHFHVRVRDKFGDEIKEGDTVCFTLPMRIDQKPIVKATVAGFIYAKPGGKRDSFIVLGDYIDCPDVEWARREDKLIKKVLSDRVVLARN
jgi:hypothetical protein